MALNTALLPARITYWDLTLANLPGEIIAMYDQIGQLRPFRSELSSV